MFFANLVDPVATALAPASPSSPSSPSDAPAPLSPARKIELLALAARACVAAAAAAPRPVARPGKEDLDLGLGGDPAADDDDVRYSDAGTPLAAAHDAWWDGDAATRAAAGVGTDCDRLLDSSLAASPFLALSRAAGTFASVLATWAARDDEDPDAAAAASAALARVLADWPALPLARDVLACRAMFAQTRAGLWTRNGVAPRAIAECYSTVLGAAAALPDAATLFLSAAAAPRATVRALLAAYGVTGQGDPGEWGDERCITFARDGGAGLMWWR